MKFASTESIFDAPFLLLEGVVFSSCNVVASPPPPLAHPTVSVPSLPASVVLLLALLRFFCFFFWFVVQVWAGGAADYAPSDGRWGRGLSWKGRGQVLLYSTVVLMFVVVKACVRVLFYSLILVVQNISRNVRNWYSTGTNER